MSMIVGIALIGIFVLSVRWLKHWYASQERSEGFADGLAVNFVLPALAAALMSGALSIGSALLDGITLIDAAAASAVVFGLIAVAWREMSREKRPDNVVPLTPKAGDTSPPPPTPVEAPRRVA